MRERGILMSAPMVRALLAGTKTQTRRIVKPQPPTMEAVTRMSGSGFSVIGPSASSYFRIAGPVWAVRDLMGIEPEWRCPYGVPGDRLWVRETWKAEIAHGHGFDACDCADVRVGYVADDSTSLFWEDQIHVGWTMPKAARHGGRVPGIHMPRWASRITLEVTDVHVERLQNISEEDAKAEGAPCADLASGREAILGDGTHQWGFRLLWESINGAESWRANPWVWAISFKVVS